MAEPPPFNPDTVSGPTFSLSVEYTDELLMTAYKRAYIRVMLFVGVFVLVLCLCFSVIGDWKLSLPVLVAVLAVIPLTAILNFKRAFLMSSDLFRKMDHRQVDFTFDDYGVLQVSALGTNRFRWDMFIMLTRRRGLWLLHLAGRRGAHLIPVALMTPDLQDFIVRKCSENGVKVR